MDKNEALDILKAFVICHIPSRKFTCNDCPFNGDFIKENGKTILHCTYHKKLSNERVEEALKVLSE